VDAAGVRDTAADLPAEPGVYQFLAGETTLYVGKAVDLRDRVRSYADPRSDRIRQMRSRADAVDVAVTDTETQALLLEANLIKRLRPRYNVRLKDDKSYPMIQLTDHAAPRVGVTRDPDPGAAVYGPFTDVGEAETAVKAAREQFGLRGCSDHKYEGRDRPCLDHEMGLCSAPCTGEIGLDDYADDVEAVRRYLDGETGVLAGPIRREMAAASEAEQFERAANLRDRLTAVESLHGGGGEAVASEAEGRERRVDVLAAAAGRDGVVVARLRAEDGKLVDRSRHRLATGDDEDPGPAAALAAFVPQFYAERGLPDAVLLAERLPAGDEDVREWLETRGVAVRVPGAGREATLVDLALKNARRGRERDDPVADLSRALGLASARRVEGFDVSHTGGTGAVGSNVCFVDGGAETSAYRRKRLADENDDYANTRALVRWRAERAVEGRDDRPDPDLLVVDGGEGQLGAAQSALSETGWDVPCVALAKAEELVVTPDGVHDWPSEAPRLRLCRQVRDEAHRFAVQYHRTVRDEVETTLDGVPGVGAALRQRLLGRFGSVENVRAASRDELLAVEGVGESTAAAIRERL
jgi:excinuclease ABC subunit C